MGGGEIRSESVQEGEQKTRPGTNNNAKKRKWEDGLPSFQCTGERKRGGENEVEKRNKKMNRKGEEEQNNVSKRENEKMSSLVLRARKKEKGRKDKMEK